MSTATAARPVIVVGAGVAGWTAVREFRKRDTNTPVLLVTADAGDFYAKPTLSNAYAQKRVPAQLITTPAAGMAQTQQVQLLAHSVVEHIDTAAHRITLRHAGNLQTLDYRQLVLATGAHPIHIPVQGDAAAQVHSINHLDDFAAFHAALGLHPGGQDGSTKTDSATTVLIMGAGLIGCEFANDLAQAGVQVHVVDPSPRPLAALLPDGASAQLQAALAAVGVQWHFGTSVAALHHHADARVHATLANGSAVRADRVLSAVGLRADTCLAQAAGLACERGILVDTQLQTSAPDVFALGDCAQYASAGQRTLPYVMPVMNAAKALAATLCGTPTELVFPLMPVSIKTPALPIVVAVPHPAVQGHWQLEDAAGVWCFIDATGVQRGFVLTGSHTAKRMQMVQRTTP